uniref:acyl-CoA-binding domain-containing protein 1-like n=1 Tax=Erigeron canadensis TaxID=72917 RepID=UPI001CB99B4B|nr:acyl-CoA-binding domain-containing protein 1-like [Erigeron canadensis]
MLDWQQYTQSIILGLIFSYLVSKLFSLILSFRHQNLRLTRSTSSLDDQEQQQEEEPLIPKDITENEPVSNNDSDDDDWEGVESTELDETFSAATAFVAATAADKSSQKVSSELQLQLYGLYKIATEGPCSAPQPSALKITARAKWNAWQKLGAMPPEEAMIKYIEIITQLYPTWAAGSTSRRGENDNERSSNDTRPMGPVFSSFIHEEESDELKLDAVHAFAREGDTENLIKCVESGVPVDTKDSEGRTPLHWAVDRGHVEAAELLLSRNADVNIKDNEGQTPLHYAAVCERESIAELLVKKNAATDIKDDDGNYPFDLCDSKWPWIQPQVPSFDS